MKKILSMLLAVTLILSLYACGKSEAFKQVENLIGTIDGSETSIAAAEDAYNALTDEEKNRLLTIQN